MAKQPERERLDDLSYHDILQREIRNALREISRPPPAVFISGVAAGLNVSFGALFVGMTLAFSNGFSSLLVERAVLGGVSTIGFLFVISARPSCSPRTPRWRFCRCSTVGPRSATWGSCGPS